MLVYAPQVYIWQAVCRFQLFRNSLAAVLADMASALPQHPPTTINMHSSRPPRLLNFVLGLFRTCPRPLCVLEYLLRLLLAWIGFHGSLSPGLVATLAGHLLSLLLGWAADGPVYLAEDVGFDRCDMSQHTATGEMHLAALGYSPSTQYGHRICSRLTLPHPEHRFSDVMSFNPLPAMNRCRFLRYDVFFFGTALSSPSQMSASDGIDGSESDGIASAPKSVLSAPKGCERRGRNGMFGMGRMAPLRPGSSVCHSGESGRASAIVACMYRI
jgi:hypothetical protein